MLVSKFSLKYGVMMIAVLMLTACQSIKNEQIAINHYTDNVIPDSAKDLFFDYKQADSAKTSVLQALDEHLHNERFAVSNYYYQMSSLYTKDSVDKNADSIWTSVIKVREYRRNKNSIDSKGFRSQDDYLPTENLISDKDDLLEEASESAHDKSQLPYLRYDDEMLERSPKTVTRQVGMGEDYAQINEKINSLDTDIRFCVYDASYSVDAAVSGNPNIDNKDKKIQQAQKELNQCQKAVTKTANQLLKQAQGYQVNDIHHLTSCLAEYKTGLADIMKPGRQPKTLEDESLEKYDVVHYNFVRCRDQFDITQILEPSSYTKNGYTKEFLDTTSKIKQCSQSSIDRQAALRKLGKNYTYNADEFLQSYVDYATCAGTAIDNEEQTLETFSDARERLYEVDAYIRSEGVDYLKDYYKYRGLSGWLTLYKEMKESEGQKQTTKDELYDGFLKNVISSMLNHAKKTPEQIHAQNIYQNNHTVTTGLWHHNPKAKVATGLVSLDYESATAKQSIQLPIEFDFKQGAINADVSALLPVVALINPKNAPLPNEVADGRMTFALPPTLSQKIPTDVIYEAINEGILAAIADLNPQDFTKMDLSKDKYAKEIGANQVIKINLSSKEQGKILDVIAKKTAINLKQYVDNHPDFYPDITKQTDKKPTQKSQEQKMQTDKIKKAIDDFALFSSAHRANDVGGLFQMLEGLIPFSLTQNSYLYLDNTGKLVAVQTFMAIDDDIQDVSHQMVNQIRFDKAIFDTHPLAGKFAQAFDKTAPKPTFDGTTWLKNKIDEHRFQSQAELARMDDDYDSNYDSGYDDVGLDDDSDVSDVKP